MKQKIGHNRVETAGHTGLMMNGVHAKNVTPMLLLQGSTAYKCDMSKLWVPNATKRPALYLRESIGREARWASWDATRRGE